VDLWHRLGGSRLRALIGNVIRDFRLAPGRAVNLGSGGKTFNIPAEVHIHIDLVHKRLVNKIGIVANIEHLPLKDSSADLAICLGSVINHGDGKAMLSEIGRILRPGSLLILEFDCADGLHHGWHSPQEDPVLINTFFNGQMLTLFEYSRRYIEHELESNGLTIECRHSFHILSSLLLSFRVPPSVAAAFIYFDRIARLSPQLRYRGSNMFLIARRK
jgi:SAM-dependent methyltransferase